MDISLEEMENKVPKCEPRYEEIGRCRCGELDERSRKAETKIVELELEIGKRKAEYEELEAKLKDLEAEKSAFQEELRASRMKNDEVNEPISRVRDEREASYGAQQGVKMVVDLTEEEDGFHLMNEIKILECEKEKAEGEAEIWKRKFEELESRVSKIGINLAQSGVKQNFNVVDEGKEGSNGVMRLDQLQTREKADSLSLVDAVATSNTSGTPYIHTPYKQDAPFIGGKKGVDIESEQKCGRQVRKHLSFNEERSPDKAVSPSTPGVAKVSSFSVINICDSDDEGEISGIQMPLCNNEPNGLGGILDMDHIPSVSTPKRKRAANVIDSDTESDEDDNVPLSKLKRMHIQESNFNESSSVAKKGSAAHCLNDDNKGVMTRLKRRIMTLRECEGDGSGERRSSRKNLETNSQRGIPTTGDVEDSESEGGESDSEGESLGGFIVESSDECDSNALSKSEVEMEDNVDYDEIISRIRRSKDHNLKWEFEAEMLAAFGKDLQLCMKAVCALYRQQTSEEQAGKETLVGNHRGFSKFDARRGSELAQFLIEGDPSGDVKKSVEELEEHGSVAVELCRTLATRYSKQLFEIYKNEEDPLFLPL